MLFADLCVVIFLCRESAATLEAESGYKLEETEVSDFRRFVLEGVWSSAEALLHNFISDKESLLVCGFSLNIFMYVLMLTWIGFVTTCRMPSFW
jgi:hypothetical protein